MLLADALGTTATIVSIVGGVIAAIAGLVSLWDAIQTKLQERREIKELKEEHGFAVYTQADLRRILAEREQRVGAEPFGYGSSLPVSKLVLVVLIAIWLAAIGLAVTQ